MPYFKIGTASEKEAAERPPRANRRSSCSKAEIIRAVIEDKVRRGWDRAISRRRNRAACVGASSWQAKDAPAAERLAVRKTHLVRVLAELGRSWPRGKTDAAETS